MGWMDSTHLGTNERDTVIYSSLVVQVKPFSDCCMLLEVYNNYCFVA